MRNRSLQCSFKASSEKVASGATKDSTRSLGRQLFGDGIQAQLYLTIQLLFFQPGPYSKNKHQDNGSYCEQHVSTSRLRIGRVARADRSSPAPALARFAKQIGVQVLIYLPPRKHRVDNGFLEGGSEWRPWRHSLPVERRSTHGAAGGVCFISPTRSHPAGSRTR
jgi:hypothetical protein